jgi:hypothetical protein
MVLTRSRRNSMRVSGTATSADMVSPSSPGQDFSPPGVAAEMMESMQAPFDAAVVFATTASASAAAPAAAASAGSVTLSNEQFQLLMSRLLRDPVSTPSFSGNFAKCTARFDGVKTSDV